jgi:hypothetical protein
LAKFGEIDVDMGELLQDQPSVGPAMAFGY